jgi:hypothetical protein
MTIHIIYLEIKCTFSIYIYIYIYISVKLNRPRISALRLWVHKFRLLAGKQSGNAWHLVNIYIRHFWHDSVYGLCSKLALSAILAQFHIQTT